MNQDVSAELLASPFARSLAPLTRLLAPDCSLYSRPPLRSLVRSLPRSWDSELLMSQNDLVLSHSATESMTEIASCRHLWRVFFGFSVFGFSVSV